MKFRILNENPLVDYREACKITQGIELNSTLYRKEKAWKPENEVEFWIKQITANHSTIRSVRFRLETSAPRSVIMQIIRATKGHPSHYVESSRPDWVGKERSGNPYEEKLFIQDHTSESFIMMARQRLCKRTEERTRKFVEELVEELKHSEEPFLRAVGFCCAPDCVWLNGCPEVKGCSKTNKKADFFINVYHSYKAKE